MHLAEISESFLRKRGVPSKTSGLTPGPLSQNLHFPHEGVIPMHPSSRHRTVIQEDISI